jgi:hypothetical protein
MKQKICPVHEHTATPKQMSYSSLFTCGNGQIFYGTFECSLGGLKCDHSYDAIWTWMDISDDGDWPVKCCRVVFLQLHDVSWLEVRGYPLPALALELMEVIG